MVRNTRSGWGIMIVARPSELTSPAIPLGEPNPTMVVREVRITALPVNFTA